MTESWEILEGDCLDRLREMSDASVDSIVTDPPSGISFMGKGWDSDKGGRDKWIAWLADVMREALRVAKPGAHAFVWALPRTQHWTATAIENAGWEVRDVVSHIFGNGFPKSADVSKAIDKAAGVEREVIETEIARVGFDPKGEGGGGWSAGEIKLTAPATDAAKQWAGFGTALKPSHECWILARKPPGSTIAACVLEHGTGALNVDACRVATDGRRQIDATAKTTPSLFGAMGGSRADGDTTQGRWPPNLALSHAPGCAETCAEGCAVAEMDAQSGERPSQGAQAPGQSMFGLDYDGRVTGRGDSGGASRFFPTFRYEPKPSRSEREAGCEALPAKTREDITGREPDSPGQIHARSGKTASNIRNHHPTVKSIGLMRWLCRLVTPPGGLVLDPFAGSGTTGIAAREEGFRFLGFEQDPEFVAIARARISHATRQAQLFDPSPPPRPAEKSEPAQRSLFGEPTE